MKRILSLSLILLILIPCIAISLSSAEEGDIDSTASAQQASVDLSQFSIDELLELRDRIRLRLIEKGYNPYYDLDRNDKGEDVAHLQERLTELGYYSGNISGKYDSTTAQAMKQFEKHNDLPNDGKASREDQLVLFSDQAKAKMRITSAPIATIEPAVVDYFTDIDFSEYGALDYNTYSRNPENQRGLKVKLTGTVQQVMGNRNRGFSLLFTVGTNNIYIDVKDPGYNILDNDRLIIYAQMDGTYTYTSVLHTEITIPYAHADAITLR